MYICLGTPSVECGYLHLRQVYKLHMCTQLLHEANVHQTARATSKFALQTSMNTQLHHHCNRICVQHVYTCMLDSFKCTKHMHFYCVRHITHLRDTPLRTDFEHTRIDQSENQEVARCEFICRVAVQVLQLMYQCARTKQIKIRYAEYEQLLALIDLCL